jgi:hypothetical protein
MDEKFVCKGNLTDDDVDEVRKKLAKIPASELNDIYNSYVQLVNGILSLVHKQTDAAKKRSDNKHFLFESDAELAEIDRLKRLVNFLPRDETFIRSKDKIWVARDHIMNRNADWFLKKDYTHLIKKDKNQVMIETIVNLIKDRYYDVSPDELESYWKKGIELLHVVARYKKLTGED